MSFDPVFVEIFRFCKFKDCSRNYLPYYDVFLIPLKRNSVTKLISTNQGLNNLSLRTFVVVFRPIDDNNVRILEVG